MTIELFRLCIVLAAAIVAACLFLVRSRVSSRKYAPLVELVLVTELLIVIAYLFENLSSTLGGKLFWDSLQLCLDGCLAVAFLLFATTYTGRPLARPRTTISLLLLLPITASLLMATSPWHGWTRRSAQWVEQPMPRLTYDFETLDYLVFFELYLLFFVAGGLFLLSGLLKRSVYRTQVITLTLGVLVPAAGGPISFSGFEVLGERDLSPFLFTLGALLSSLGLAKARVFELTPVARDLWIESQRDAILVVDAEGRILDANPAAEELMLESSAMASSVGRLLGDALPAFDSLPPGGRPDGNRVDIDGRTWELRRFPVEAEGWLLVGRDISSLAASEQALEQMNQQLEMRVAQRARELERANDKFRAIFENASHFISLLDAHGHVLAMNRTALESIQLPLDDVLGKRLTDISWWQTAPEGLPQMQAALSAALAGRFTRFETQITGQEGDTCFDCSFKPIVKDGGLELIIYEGQDVTEARLAAHERERENVERAHAERMEMLGRLAGGVAHDFNNLLTIVLAASSILRESPSEAEALEAVTDIEQAAESATQVTRQLLSLSRRSSGKVEPTDVHAAVQRMAKLLDRLLGERHRVQLHLTDGQPFVRIDSGQLEQCIMNLVINARDAMQDGGIITVRTRIEQIKRGSLSSGDYLVLCVTDQGTGVNERLRARIFEAFFTTKALGHGTGLGLATVHGIVTSAHGSISLTSEEGLGSTFEIQLPTCNPHEPADTEHDARVLTGNETVALVEDVATLRDLVGRELRRLGYDVHIFSSAEQVLAFLEDRSVHLDVLITDIILPGLDGVELATALRSTNAHLPVVYTTGYSGDAALDLRGSAPHQRVVYKPYRPLAIARAIRELLEGQEQKS